MRRPPENRDYMPFIAVIKECFYYSPSADVLQKPIRKKTPNTLPHLQIFQQDKWHNCKKVVGKCK